MKKSTILEEAYIHDEDEQVYRSHVTSKPKLSYNQALQSYFIAAGAIHQVKQVIEHGLIYIIEELVNAAIATSKNPETCKKALAGLDYRDPLSCWYGLNELTRLRCTLPLFTSEAEAEVALQRQAAKTVV